MPPYVEPYADALSAPLQAAHFMTA